MAVFRIESIERDSKINILNLTLKHYSNILMSMAVFPIKEIGRESRTNILNSIVVIRNINFEQYLFNMTPNKRAVVP